MMHIDELISKRRSIYPIQYNGKKIDDNIILQILENANWAPTHHYTEPWRFKIFKNESIQTLVDFIISQYQQNTPEEKFNPKKIEKYQSLPQQTSHIIAIYMKRDQTSDTPEIEDVLSIGCTIQNIYLTITEYGLGGYLSTGLGTYSKEMHSFLNLNDDERLIGFFFLGQFDGKVPRGRKRGDIGAKIEWAS